MKKIIALILTLVLTFTFAAAGYSANTEADPDGEVVIYERRQAKATIVLPANYTEQEFYVAKKLRDYLSKVIKTELSIITDDRQANTPNEIIVSTTNRYEPDFADIKDNGYFIRSNDHSVMINGTGTRGLLYGAYAFLEDFCGIRWYEKDIISAPELSSLSVPNDLDIVYNPYFEYTEVDTTNPRDPEYSVANGLTGQNRSLTDVQGGTVNYISGFCHTLATQFCPPSVYFDEHPEYFAFHDGERVKDQLCLTNPTVLQIVTDQVLGILRDRHDPKASLQIVSLTQNDNRQFCECENCKKLDDENGSHAGTMITFANAVAKVVKEKGYDNVAIDTFAYQYTRKTPTKVVPDDNVIVRICSIECCFGHPLNDPNCKENVAFMQDLKDWGKICDRLYIWDYVNNYAQTCCIFPDFGVLQQNVQTFHENNVRGLYEEGNYYISTCDAEFGEMRSYLLAQLMKDPYCDYSAEMNGYLEAVYGRGWEKIREFIDIMTKHAVTKTRHLFIYQSCNDTLYNMLPSDVAKCDSLWKSAKALTADVGEGIKANEIAAQQLKRLDRSELCWRYWKSNNYRGEFSLLRPIKRMVEGQKLYEDMKAMGIVRLSEGSSDLSDVEFLHFFLPATNWRTGNESGLSKALNGISLFIYNNIAKKIYK